MWIATEPIRTLRSGLGSRRSRSAAGASGGPGSSSGRVGRAFPSAGRSGPAGRDSSCVVVGKSTKGPRGDRACQGGGGTSSVEGVFRASRGVKPWSSGSPGGWDDSGGEKLDSRCRIPAPRSGPRDTRGFSGRPGSTVRDVGRSGSGRRASVDGRCSKTIGGAGRTSTLGDRTSATSAPSCGDAGLLGWPLPTSVVRGTGESGRGRGSGSARDDPTSAGGASSALPGDERRGVMLISAVVEADRKVSVGVGSSTSLALESPTCLAGCGNSQRCSSA